MPIRFRCRHCKQYLGISRSKVGQVVDCPTCGRSIKVPERDGQAEAASDPALNLHDPHMARAIAELAGLAEAPAGPQPSQRPLHETPDAIPVPAITSSRKTSPTRPVRDVEPAREAPPIEVLPLAPQPPAPPASNEDEPDDRTVHYADEIAKLAQQSGTAAESHGPSGSLAILRTPLVLFALGVATTSGVALGWLIGTLQTDQTELPVSEAPLNPVPKPTPPEGVATPPVAVDGPNRPVLTGRVSYIKDDGTTRPDSDARILVLPEHRTGGVKLPAQALLQPADGPDFRVAAFGVQTAGGDVTLANSDGQFRVELPQTGNFHVLLLSQHQSRPSDAPMDAALLTLLGDYFERPRELLGQRAFHVRRVLSTAEETPSVLHVFPRES